MQRRFSRRVIVIGAAAAALGAVTLVFRPFRRFAPELDLVDLPGLVPFRQLAGRGGMSAASVALVGIEPGATPSTGAAAAVMLVTRDDLCGAVFGRTQQPGVIPFAFFTDFNCPYCRILEAKLLTLLAEDPTGLSMVRHELPLLGPASVTASRAYLAAGVQGKADAMARRLMRSRLVTDEAYVRAISDSIGLETDRLIADMQSPAVDLTLQRSRAVATLFGFYGTPALIIGRTVVFGDVSDDTLRAIIALERGEGAQGCRARSV